MEDMMQAFYSHYESTQHYCTCKMVKEMKKQEFDYASALQHLQPSTDVALEMISDIDHNKKAIIDRAQFFENIMERGADELFEERHADNLSNFKRRSKTRFLQSVIIAIVMAGLLVTIRMTFFDRENVTIPVVILMYICCLFGALLPPTIQRKGELKSLKLETQEQVADSMEFYARQVVEAKEEAKEYEKQREAIEQYLAQKTA